MASAKSNSKSSHANASGAFVICIDNSGYEASLEAAKAYRTLPRNTQTPVGYLRVIDESGEDYLYSNKRFVPVKLPRQVQRAIRAREAVSA